MDYYNLAKFIKSVVYNFVRMFKYLSYCLIAICFIAVCLLLMSSKSKAEVILNDTVNNTSVSVPDFPVEYFNENAFIVLDGNKIKSGENTYYSNTYFCYSGIENITYVRADIQPNQWIGFVTSSNWGNFYGYKYVVGSSGWVPIALGLGNSYSSPCYSVLGNTSTYQPYSIERSALLFTNIQFRYRSGNDRIVIGEKSDFTIGAPFVSPEIQFPNNNGTADYISGQFSDFMILGNDSGVVYFSFNDGSVSELDGQKSVYLELNTSSPYYLNNYIDNHVWLIPKNILGGYYDGHIYNLSLDWQENGVWKHSEVYSWTTSFSEQAILNDEERYRQNMQNSIDGIDNFLKDDSYNSNSITDNMPTTEIEDPTATQVDNIFNMFRNVFSTENAQDIVFQVPNTDETITIPANLVTSHIPEPILLLVQGLYWFLICRFIVKDISKTVEHAKSGEILDAQDGNIKTDLL